MARKEFTPKTKRLALKKHVTCPGPKCGIDFTEVKRIEFDHIIPAGMGGDNSLENCMPLCSGCHDLKTNGQKHTSYGSDKHIIFKGKRLRGETKTGPKAKIPSRPFATNRDGKYKTPLNGRTELRKSGKVRK